MREHRAAPAKAECNRMHVGVCGEDSQGYIGDKVFHAHHYEPVGKGTHCLAYWRRANANSHASKARLRQRFPSPQPAKAISPAFTVWPLSKMGPTSSQIWVVPRLRAQSPDESRRCHVARNAAFQRTLSRSVAGQADERSECGGRRCVPAVPQRSIQGNPHGSRQACVRPALSLLCCHRLQCRSVHLPQASGWECRYYVDMGRDIYPR